jgi:hypothetical protein
MCEGLARRSIKYKATAVLVGYFDESGTTKDQGIALYGGIVADSVMWSRIELRWRRKLEDYGLSEYHAVNCELRHGEFIKYEKPVRDALTNYFSNLIAELPCQAFGAAIVHKDWEKLVPPHIKAHFGANPLYMAAAICVQQISSWSRQFAEKEAVALVFAEHEEHSSVISKIHSELYRHIDWPGLGPINFSSPKFVIPLQAADLLCYEMRQFLMRPDASDRQARKNFERRGEMQVNLSRYTEENLPALIEHWESSLT